MRLGSTRGDAQKRRNRTGNTNGRLPVLYLYCTVHELGQMLNRTRVANVGRERGEDKIDRCLILEMEMENGDGRDYEARNGSTRRE